MRNFTLFTVFLTVVGLSTAAEAHAMLDHASPAVGSTVGSSPGQVTLYFTQAARTEVQRSGGAQCSRRTGG